MADIVGLSEIAERVHVEVGTVRQWRKRYDDFPEPLLVLRMGNLYLWPEVEEWVHRHKLV